MYYDPQSAGINMQSPCESTPRRLTLGWTVPPGTRKTDSLQMPAILCLQLNLEITLAKFLLLYKNSFN